MRNPQNAAHKSLSPEEFVIDVPYAITLNPNDSIQNFDQPLRIQRFKDSMQNWFIRLSDVCKLQMYLEISKGGRLHYHGTITFKTYDGILKFFLEYVYLLKAACTYEIDTIADKDAWLKYCTKQTLIKPNYFESPDEPPFMVSNMKLMKVERVVKSKKMCDY